MIQCLGRQQDEVGRKENHYIYSAAVQNGTLEPVMIDFYFLRGLSKILLQQNTLF